MAQNTTGRSGLSDATRREWLELAGKGMNVAGALLGTTVGATILKDLAGRLITLPVACPTYGNGCRAYPPSADYPGMVDVPVSQFGATLAICALVGTVLGWLAGGLGQALIDASKT